MMITRNKKHAQDRINIHTDFITAEPQKETMTAVWGVPDFVSQGNEKKIFHQLLFVFVWYLFCVLPVAHFLKLYLYHLACKAETKKKFYSV